VLGRLDDLRQRRPAKRVQAQEAGAERGSCLAVQRGRVALREGKRPRDSPFAGFRGPFKYKRI
jgi:hypothetical protein